MKVSIRGHFGEIALEIADEHVRGKVEAEETRFYESVGFMAAQMVCQARLCGQVQTAVVTVMPPSTLASEEFSRKPTVSAPHSADSSQGKTQRIINVSGMMGVCPGCGVGSGLLGAEWGLCPKCERERAERERLEGWVVS